MPGYMSILVAVEVALILLAVARQVRESARADGANSRSALLFGVGYIGWILVTAGLAARHVYRLGDSATVPWLAIGFAIPLVGLLLLARLPKVGGALSDPGILTRLTRPHATRVGGVIFLIALGLGELPPLFALPAGLGDIAVGLATPWVLRGLREGNYRRAVWFNILGIVDFLVAFTIAFFGAPGRTQLIHLTPDTQQVSLFPLVLIPTAGVPLLLALHLISLAKLRARVSATTTAATPAVN
ncbi:hypothetical protein [Nocardia alni]|uniref:hypothetical protein n=1 Tax=Nocardia alni TaxID=2815723 RepID=UPI001C24DA7C|nr:hypothetical protein [Nocardia alni]